MCWIILSLSIYCKLPKSWKTCECVTYVICLQKILLGFLFNFWKWVLITWTRIFFEHHTSKGDNLQPHLPVEAKNLAPIMDFLVGVVLFMQIERKQSNLTRIWSEVLSNFVFDCQWFGLIKLLSVNSKTVDESSLRVVRRWKKLRGSDDKKNHEDKFDGLGSLHGALGQLCHLQLGRQMYANNGFNLRTLIFIVELNIS